MEFMGLATAVLNTATAVSNAIDLSEDEVKLKLFNKSWKQKLTIAGIAADIAALKKQTKYKPSRKKEIRLVRLQAKLAVLIGE